MHWNDNWKDKKRYYLILLEFLFVKKKILVDKDIFDKYENGEKYIWNWLRAHSRRAKAEGKAQKIKEKTRNIKKFTIASPLLCLNGAKV